MQTLPSQSYSSLSLKDLLDARDAYHIALMKKSNVRLAGDKSTARSGSALTQGHVKRTVDSAAFAPSYTLSEIQSVLQ